MPKEKAATGPLFLSCAVPLTLQKIPENMKHMHIRPVLLLALLTPLLFLSADSTRLQLEAGPAWFSRNDVRVPGDNGDRFDLNRLTGTGPVASARINLVHPLDTRQSLRLTLAPVRTEGTGTLSSDTRFGDQIFSADEPVKSSYRFDTYRLGYRRNFSTGPTWTLGWGGVLLVRDAEITLEQNQQTETSDNLGVVPLLGFYADGKVSESISVHLDAEGLASPYGRAFDIALQTEWALNEQWSLSGSLRTIEGGADNDEVYTFAWIQFVHLGVIARF